MQEQSNYPPRPMVNRPPLAGQLPPASASAGASSPTIPAVTEAEREKFNKSAKWIQWLSYAGKFFVIFYTLPHNLMAFGMGNGAVFQWATLGVFTIELSWLTTMIHYSHGWLSSKKQATAAHVSLATTTSILILNAISSQLAHMSSGGRLQEMIDFVTGKEAAGEWVYWVFVDFYGGFLLPATPVLSVLAVSFLISRHPQVEQLAATFRFIATEAMLKRNAVLDKETASGQLQAQKIKSSSATMRAQLKAEEIRANVEATRIENSAIQESMLIQFEQKRLNQAMAVRQEEMDKLINSEDFKGVLRQAEQNSLLALIQELYPGFVASTPAGASPMPVPVPTPAVVPVPVTPSANGHGHFVGAVVAHGAEGDDGPLVE